MGLFGISRKELRREIDGLKAMLSSTGRYDMQTNTIVWNAGSDSQRIKDGYQANALVYSIIQGIAGHVTRPEWGEYAVKDSRKAKEYRRYKSSLKSVTGRDFRVISEMKEAAFEKVDGHWEKLFKYPNATQTWGELTTDELIFFLCTGNAITGAIRLDTGLNAGLPQELFTIPASLTQIWATSKYPAAVSKYVLQIGTQHEYSADDVCHFKFAAVDYSANGSQLWGMSPLQAAAHLLTESNYASEASAKAFNNTGTGKIVFIDDQRLTYEQARAATDIMKEKWNNEHQKGKDNFRATQFVGAKLGVADVGLSPVDLDIIKAKGLHKEDMCAVYQYPPVLLSPDNSALNNIKTARKEVISGPVMRFLIAKRDAYNRKYALWGGDKNRHLDFDIACFTELAEEHTERAKLLNMVPAKLREYYQYTDREIPEGVSDEELNMWVIPGNLKITDDPTDGAGLDVNLNNNGVNDY